MQNNNKTNQAVCYLLFYIVTVYAQFVTSLPGETIITATVMSAKTMRMTSTAMMIPFQFLFSGFEPTSSC